MARTMKNAWDDLAALGQVRLMPSGDGYEAMVNTPDGQVVEYGVDGKAALDNLWAEVDGIGSEDESARYTRVNRSMLKQEQRRAQQELARLDAQLGD